MKFPRVLLLDPLPQPVKQKLLQQFHNQNKHYTLTSYLRSILTRHTQKNDQPP